MRDGPKVLSHFQQTPTVTHVDTRRSDRKDRRPVSCPSIALELAATVGAGGIGMTSQISRGVTPPDAIRGPPRRGHPRRETCSRTASRAPAGRRRARDLDLGSRRGTSPRASNSSREGKVSWGGTPARAGLRLVRRSARSQRAGLRRLRGYPLRRHAAPRCVRGWSSFAPWQRQPHVRADVRADVRAQVRAHRP